MGDGMTEEIACPKCGGYGELYEGLNPEPYAPCTYCGGSWSPSYIVGMTTPPAGSCPNRWTPGRGVIFR